MTCPKKLLLVKISSMGDLIHTLPALTDLMHNVPGVKVDWVAEESFSEIPSWHPIVDRTILVAHRRWKKTLFKSLSSGELNQFRKQLRHNKYDVVLDAQSNLKSGVITALARGTRCGVDKQSAHEWGTTFSYHKRFPIDKNQHAVDRMRQLFAKTFEYELPNSAPDYAIQVDQLPVPDFALPKRFIFLTHVASRDFKLWPVRYWLELMTQIQKAGYGIVLPWGSDAEKQRAELFASEIESAVVMPPMSLSEKAYVISRASGAVSLDTGLGHLTAALNIPNVSLYGPTDPKLIGALGQNQSFITADFPCAPCLRSSCHYQGDVKEFPACMATITPAQVLESLLEKL